MDTKIKGAAIGGIDPDTHQNLKKMCKKLGISQGDFVKLSLEYFRKTGINPADPPESAKEQMAQMEKRLSQVIAFQKTFEKEQLLPLLDSIKQSVHILKQQAPQQQQGEVNPLFSNIQLTLQKVLQRIEVINTSSQGSSSVDFEQFLLFFNSINSNVETLTNKEKEREQREIQMQKTLNLLLENKKKGLFS